MKHLARLLMLSLLVFYSCSQQTDDAWGTIDPPQTDETNPVEITFTRSSLESFAEQGITEIGIYAYLKDSLVFGKTMPLNDGNLKVDLPLGESLQTFAIANAGQMIDTDSLSKVTVRMDAAMQKQVFISKVVDFTSDKSVKTLSLELKRLVGQAVFQPKETTEVLNAVTQFDQLSITFTNAGVAYKIKTGVCTQEDVTVKVDRTAGFSASIYALPTLSGDARTAVNVVYLKNNEEVNRTNSPLDTGIAFESSKRSVVNMPILEEAYLSKAWTRASVWTSTGTEAPLFTIEESEF